MPTKESALFSRSILLEFTNGNWGDPEAYNHLKKIEKGLGNVLLELLSQRDLIQNQFKTAFDHVYAELRKDNTLNIIPDRNVKNITALLAPFKLLSKVIQIPFSFGEIASIMDTPLGTALARAHRGLKKLRAMMEDGAKD